MQMRERGKGLHCPLTLREKPHRRTSMEIVAQWFHAAPEKAQAGLMLYGFVQLVAAIMMSRFLKRPEK
jgi:hypothetical protein